MSAKATGRDQIGDDRSKLSDGREVSPLPQLSEAGNDRTLARPLHGVDATNWRLCLLAND